MNQAIIFGAGNIGRGFIGQLFSESGYKVTFVDIDQPLLDAFNRQHSYTIRLVTNESSREVTVAPVEGIEAGNRTAVAKTIANAQIGATAVGARVLKYVAPNVAAGIISRADQGVEMPFNLILCENLKGAARIFEEMVRDALPAKYHAYQKQYIGFVDTVIARMIPPLTPELRAEDPSLVIAEPYKELPIDAAGFVGPVPEITGLIPATEFSFYTERKLYIHNAGHAVLGYLGYQHNYKFGYEALSNPQIAAAVKGAMTESQQALEKKYNLPRSQLSAYVDDIMIRFGNRALGDTVFRLGRDPVRKLAHNDRLIGAALNTLAQGIEPVYLVQGITAALQFDSPDDPVAVELQNRRWESSLEAVLQEVCGLESNSSLTQLIAQQF